MLETHNPAEPSFVAQAAVEVLPDAQVGKNTEKSVLAGDFVDEMQRLGFRATILEGESNPLPNLVQSLTLIEHDTPPDESTVRLYRGVRPNQGKQLAHQVGYLLKKPVYSEYGHITNTELESAETFSAVEAFSEHPSYRNIIEAVNTASMTESNRRFVNDRIKDLRRSMVMFPGRTLLDELTWQHITSPWGAPTQDISPFVATSLHPEVAAGHGGKTLMVLDVPLSKVAGLGEGRGNGFEVLVTGTIRPEWITATAELHHNEHMSTDTLAPLMQMLGEQTATSPHALQNTELHRKSTQNHQEDLLAVNQDLIGEILEAPSVSADALREEFARQGITAYKDALWTAADYYLKKIQAMGHRRNDNIHQLYQHDDVTLTDYKPGEILEGNSARRLTIEEVDTLAKIYTRILATPSQNKK